LLALGLAAALALRTDPGSAALEYAWTRVRGDYTIPDRLDMHGGDVAARVAPHFAAKKLHYPPKRLALLAFKDRKLLEVYARDDDTQAWKFVLVYPVQGLSGHLGPKLREGDRQVPEGFYRATFLNANSQFHVSIRLDYPNEFDRAMAVVDGRDKLGSDIMIHGSSASLGCLAMGNETAETLFVLASHAGLPNVRVIISPTDFRRAGSVVNVQGPPWLGDLYGKITLALREFPAAR
jgi:murein L,D-transpeptidase YafK